ncbi:hypothetical protein RJ641_027071 [Dillenia turbinata]|uniref:Uncharacterized protein n=1 Tax=Dillenia turbinata TaxID=194707 RepID=A0AAN8VWS7_9MAGN
MMTMMTMAAFCCSPKLPSINSIANIRWKPHTYNHPTLLSHSSSPILFLRLPTPVPFSDFEEIARDLVSHFTLLRDLKLKN